MTVNSLIIISLRIDVPFLIIEYPIEVRGVKKLIVTSVRLKGQSE